MIQGDSFVAPLNAILSKYLLRSLMEFGTTHDGNSFIGLVWFLEYAISEGSG